MISLWEETVIYGWKEPLSFRKQKKAVKQWDYLISGKPAADITADLNPCFMWTGILTRESTPIIRK